MGASPTSAVDHRRGITSLPVSSCKVQELRMRNRRPCVRLQLRTSKRKTGPACETARSRIATTHTLLIRLLQHQRNHRSNGAAAPSSQALHHCKKKEGAKQRCARSEKCARKFFSVELAKERKTPRGRKFCAEFSDHVLISRGLGGNGSLLPNREGSLLAKHVHGKHV